MVLAHFNAASESPLPHAVGKALLAVQQILLRTHLFSLAKSGVSGSATPRPLHRAIDGGRRRESMSSVIPSDTELDVEPRRKAKRMRLRELRVVQERELLVDASEGWPGKKLDWDQLL
jgi:pyridoxine kinase